ncbi:M23 family metallopeptidase [Labrys wisconsinensis]|uniref:M23ase beta-sheet core domain-containing protein n=1 Tax=Labrys wisconsinensis TaxID=425677 RepID=A0ABU0JE23_9HYPH|nr:M23 family metallopeptidase [Labrys wisconsinensis]MDQ0471766.1 hypothetical protein [Labrys wisconsinensis]
MSGRTARLLGLALAAIGLCAFESKPPGLGLPLDCTVGQTCFVQQYVDHDPGPGVLDYRCGAQTYDGHDGVDIRLLSARAAEAGVRVLAPMAGRIKALRNDMPDHLVATEADRAAVARRECGNGVVLTGPDGWEVQLCHMRQGSVSVRVGDEVAAGAPLGLVGSSGMAAFAHVHMTVRRAGTVLDPFTAGPMADKPACPAGPAAASLWSAAAAAQLAYRDGAIIETGFAAAPVSPGELELRGGAVDGPASASPALIFYGRFINLKAGDRVRLTLTGPAGFAASTLSDPLERSKATYVSFVGKKRTQPAWPAGRYLGRVEIVRDGQVAESREGAYELRG